jgi:hypothetical protein
MDSKLALQILACDDDNTQNLEDLRELKKRQDRGREWQRKKEFILWKIQQNILRRNALANKRKHLEEVSNDRGSNDSGSNDSGSNDSVSNDMESNDSGSNGMGSNGMGSNDRVSNDMGSNDMGGTVPTILEEFFRIGPPPGLRHKDCPNLPVINSWVKFIEPKNTMRWVDDDAFMQLNESDSDVGVIMRWRTEPQKIQPVATCNRWRTGPQKIQPVATCNRWRIKE